MADDRARKLADKGSTRLQRSHSSADTHLHCSSEHFSNCCSPAPTRLDTASVVGSARYTEAEEAQYLEATSGHTAEVCDDSLTMKHLGNSIRKENDMAKKKMGLVHRKREKSGEIDKKHGDTLVGTLRKTYGPGFAKGRRADLMLNNLLKDAKCESPSEYLKKVQ